MTESGIAGPRVDRARRDRSTVRHRVVVLGGGYAGLAAARRLRRRLPRTSDVVLVNRSRYFVERVRLHQLATEQPVRRPLITGVDLEVGEVTGLDLQRGLVHVDRRRIGFDTVVYALGSAGDLHRVPGAQQHAVPVGSLAGAELIARRLSRLPASEQVVVVGGGLTGIETAAEIAEARPDLSVVLACADLIGGWLHPRARRHVLDGLGRLGVSVQEGVVVSAVAPDGVVTGRGGAIPGGLTVWAAGFAVSPIAADAGLAVDGRGRVVVDERLRSLSHPQVYAVGDAASATAADGRPTRMSCQTGLPMGSYAAAAITAELRGRAIHPFRMRYVWQNISLGRRDGVTQFTRFDDTPRPVVLTGRSSARFKELITRSAAWAATG